MGRVNYPIYCLTARLAGPRNIATYALNRLAAGESERDGHQGCYQHDFFKHLFRLHNNAQPKNLTIYISAYDGLGKHTKAVQAG